jgi:hypothetical protein
MATPLVAGALTQLSVEEDLMSWKNHLSQEDRKDLEKKSIDHLARLVRFGFEQGLWFMGNKARKAAGEKELQVHPMVKTRINGAMAPWIDGVVRNLYDRAGRPGVDHLAWLELQFQTLCSRAENLFRNHRD